MNIQWYGQTCFKINTQQNKKTVTILIDALDEEKGFRGPKLEADIFLLSTIFEENKEVKNLKEKGFVIFQQGEYDLKGVFIQTIQTKTKSNQYSLISLIESEEIKICHLGRTGQKELNPEQIEKIGEVDILMLSVGGSESFDSKEAVKVMSQIEPKIIIPMYYQSSKIKNKLEKLESFLKILGLKSISPLPKISLKRKDISNDEAKIIVLEE